LSRILERLVFGLNASDLSFNLLLPTVFLILKSLICITLELPNLVKLCLLLNLEKSLLNGLRKQNVQDGLHFTIIIEQIIILNLSDLIDPRLLWDVRRGRRSLDKLVCLHLDLSLLRAARLVLLSQEVSEVDLDAGRRAGPQIIWGNLVLRLLELYELGLDHLNLLLFPLSLNAELLFLHGR